MQDVVIVNASSDLIPSPEDLEIIIHYELEIADFHKNPSRFLESFLAQSLEGGVKSPTDASTRYNKVG
ncbi:hypothetical protein N7493_003448 [Penicillium malachiteum]|uniref:Uncharacterized protein n=1 Tax=Penicillium malachiteum TaxID=1324776 RepID=A0AAD6HQ79_9EURO|nr:hypothetical protein N7493_003448 [Penicillium malachiteum]